MRVVTAEQTFERLARTAKPNRWFLRADFLAWPRRAWVHAASAGGWSIIENDEEEVAFAVRTADSFRRSAEVSLADVTEANYGAALAYAADFWNAYETVCWLPSGAQLDAFSVPLTAAFTIPSFYDAGGSPSHAVVVESHRKDDRAYLSLP